MKDVAELAGVSFKTVSRVVNDEPGVSPAVTSRVKDAIATLSYRPDDRARGLRRRGTSPTTIGFIHADMSNPFFTAIHQGLEEVATTKDCLILTGSSNESPERHDALVNAFSSRRVDGLVVVPVDAPDRGGQSEALRAEIDRGTPVVFVDRESDLVGDLVMSDHYGGAVIGTDHLIAHGHRRIAFLGDQHYLYSAAERRRGFLNAMDRAGIVEFITMSDVTSEAQAEAVARDLLLSENPPTALFTAQNFVTIGAVRALHATGCQESTALVGLDHIEMADVLRPGVTLLPQDAGALGQRAGELLFERLMNADAPPTRAVLPLSLVPRGSGEIPGPFA